MRVNERMKKVWSILLTFCMLMSSLPVTTLAEENAANGLCEHHQVHTAECGYVEATSGTPCTHTCEESCYTSSTACVHTHDGTCSYQTATAPTPCGHVHDESCGYAVAVAEVTCACVPGEDGTLAHTEGCGYVAPVAEQPCTHTHDGNCGYSEGTAEVPCDHICSTYSGCVTSVPNCQHVHDGNCGYVEAVEGHECHFECNDCAQGETSGETEKETESETETTTDTTEQETETTTDATEPETETTTDVTEEETETDPVCDCGTDDESIHATTCAVYVAPENPQCFCAEKCTETNIWCDVCGFDITACGGTDTAAEYEGTAVANTVTDFSITDIDLSDSCWINEVDLESGGGTDDVGKTAFGDGDEILVTLTSQAHGTQTVALTFDGGSYTWTADGYFQYAEGETPTLTAVYAPSGTTGLGEYIVANASIVEETDGEATEKKIKIDFTNATRNYSRLRIVGLAGQTYTVTTTDFTPAGATSMVTEPYTLTADKNGNAYLYGTFAEYATLVVKQGEFTLAEYAFVPEKMPGGTEHNMSYALDARSVIDGSLGEATEDDINTLVEQFKNYVDNGITTIVIPGTEHAMYDSVMGTIPAYAEALYLLADGNTQSPYCGTIDLILPDATEIVDHAFDNAHALKSITLPKVTTVGDGAFYGCQYLQTITFGSVVTTINQNKRVVFHYVGKNVGGCDLVLNCGQMNSTYIPDLTANTWYDDNNKYFKSITLTHTKRISATCTAQAVCFDCGESYGELDAENHNYGAWTSNGNGTHTRTCSNDNTHTESDSCSGGTATCKELAVCDICKTAYGELADHIPAENATYTDNGDGKHSYTCSVCEETVSAAHDFTGDGTCVCGAECPHSNFDSTTGICGDCETPVAIAKIETNSATTYYLTTDDLRTAIASNSNNQTLTLLADFAIIETFHFHAEGTKNTLDLNGHTLICSGSTMEQILLDGCELTITGTGSINIFMGADAPDSKIVVGSGVTLNDTLRSAYGGVLDLTGATIPEAGLNVILWTDGTTYNVSDVLKLPADYYFFVDGKAVSSYSVETEGTVLKHTEHSYTYTDNGDGTHDATCNACGTAVDTAEAHTIVNHECTLCGAKEIVVSFDAGDYEWKTGDQICLLREAERLDDCVFTAMVAEDGTVTWKADKPFCWYGEGEQKLFAAPNNGWSIDYFVIPKDQSTPAKLDEADLINAMWAGNPTTDTITFNMKHRMAKVTVNYEFAEGVSADISELKVYSIAQIFRFSIDDWSIITSAGQYDVWVTPYHNGNQFTAFISPETYATGEDFIKITLSDGTAYEVKMNKAVTFAEGEEYTYKVIINADSAYLTCANGCTNFTYTNNGDGTHKKVCTDCGYEVASEAHNGTATYVVNTNDSTKHDVTYSCCNGTVTEAHTMDATTGKCICGVDLAVASITSGETVTYYETFALAQAAWTDGTTLTLQVACTAESEITISEGTRTLDLNGCTLTGSIRLDSGSLTVMDDSTEPGTLTGALNVYGGSLTVNGGSYGGVSAAPMDDVTVQLYSGTFGKLTRLNKFLIGFLPADHYIYTSDGKVFDATLNSSVENVTVRKGADLTGNASITVADVTYNGSEQRSPVTVTLGGRTLTQDEDYTLAYSRTGENPADITSAGEITVTVTGMGNYTGTETATYTIGKAAPEKAHFYYTMPSSAVYNGKPYEATVSVAEGIEGMGEITVVYHDFDNNAMEGAPVNAGETHEYYSVYVSVAEGTNYAASDSIYLDRFQIAPYEIKSGDISLRPTTMTYTGEALQPSAVVKCGDMTLVEGIHYTVDYSDNINVTERARVTVKGIGNCTGETYKEFAVVKADPAYTAPTGLTATYGDTLADVLLPAGWAWNDGDDTSVGNAGQRSFKATFTPADTQNYNTLEMELTVTVAKAKAIITMDTTTINVTYGETVPLPVATTNFGTVTCDKTAADLVNADTYTVTYTVEGTDNYEGDTKTLNVNVGQKAVAEPTVSGTYTYTGGEQTVSLTDFDDTCMIIASGNKGTNADNYEVVITLDGNHKWADGSDGKLQWSIAKAKAAITVDTAAITVTYGESVILPVATTNFGTVTCDKTAADLVNAGTYTVTYAVADTDNYDGDTKSIIVNINAKAITEADVKLNGSLNYSGSEQTQAVTVTEGITYDVTGNKATDVGTYELTVKGTGNYTGEVKLSWSIKEASATVITEPIANTLTYTGEAQALITAGTASGGEMQYSLDGENWSTDIPTAANADTYTVSYKVVGDKNHSDTDISVVNVTIKQKEVTPSVSSSYTKTYDGTNLMPEAGKALSLTLTEVIMGDSLAATADYAFTGADAGTTTVNVTNITLTGDDAKNYKLTTDTLSLDDVGKIVPLDINSGMISVYLGDELVYNGTQQTKEVSKVTVEYDRGNGTVYDVNYKVTGNIGTEAGDYTMTIEGIGNYTGSVTEDWSIGQKEITAADVKLDGSLNYNGSEQTQAVAVTEGITYEVTGNKATNVGTYELIVKGIGNYTGEVKLNWSIKEVPAAVTTAPTANTLTYTGKAQALITAGITVDGTLVYSITEDGEYSETIPTGTNADTYSVWYKVLGDANHADSDPVSISVRIHRAEVTYNAPAANTLIYDGEAQALLTAGATEHGTLMYKLGTEGTYSTSIPTGTESDTYTVYYYVNGDVNHKDSSEQKIEVTIDKLDITDQAEITVGADLTYNGKEQTKSVTSVKMGELDVTYTVSGNTGTDVGDYTMTVTANGNYKGIVTKDWSISKKKVTILANAQTITYGNAISETEYTSDGLAEGHSVTVVLTPSTANVTVDGTISASDAVILANGAARTTDLVDVTANYDISYGDEPAKLVIEPDISKIDSLTTENVTSANEADIKAVQTMMENAESIKEEWGTISETCEELIQKIETVKAENTRITDAVSRFDLTSVKSSDEETITQLIADIEVQLSTSNLTDEEKTVLEGQKTKCSNLIAKIDGTETLITQLDKIVEDLDTETVKSTDKAALEQVIADAQTLIDGGNVTAAEKETLQQTQADAQALIKVVDDTASENKALTDKAAAFDAGTVTSTDKTELEQLAQGIKDQIEKQNLTDEERTSLSDVLTQVEGMIDTIEKTSEDSKTAADVVSGLDASTVTSGDQDAINQAITTIDTLLATENLTEEERTALTQTRSDAKALLEVIEKAQNAADTENTEKVENVTSENVKPTDKEALEDAKADLEKALADNSGNYTETEKQAIQSELDRVSEALEVVQNVEDVTSLIGELPNKLNADDKDLAEEIKAAKEAYDNLTAYEKSLIDENTKEKLNELVAALEKAEESEKETEKETEVEAESGKTNAIEKTEETKEAAETGDDSHAEMWMFTMLGSLLALLILGKKRYVFQNK